MIEKPFRIRSAPEQLADHLREEIHSGRLHGEMPGVHALASEFGIHRSTVEESLRLLEQDELIRSRGAGRRRKVEPLQTTQHPSQRLALLLNSPDDAKSHIIGDLRQQLDQAGHEVVMPGKTMADLQFRADRVAKLVGATPADAWVVVAGSRGILEWFSEQAFATFALFGTPGPLRLAHAAPVKGPAISEMVQRLAGLGHRRITLLVGEPLRKPRPARVIQHFMNELQAHGIPTGPYNLPDWSHDPGSLRGCLESLFQVSRPTALIVDEGDLVPVVLQFLAEHKLSAPRDISLVCLDEKPAFKWTDPMMAHLVANPRPWIRRIVRWAENVAAGAEDHQKTLNKVKFVEGGTIGPPPGGTAQA